MKSILRFPIGKTSRALALLLSLAGTAFGAAPLLPSPKIAPSAAITAASPAFSQSLGSPIIAADIFAPESVGPSIAAPQAPRPALSVLDWLSAAPDPGAEIPAHMDFWMKAEQRLISRELDETKIVSPGQNAQDARYAPEQGAVFNVKSYWLDSDAASSFRGKGLSKSLRKTLSRFKNGRKQVRLLVHPESEKFYRGVLKNAVRSNDFKATATSSSRSLLVWTPGKEKDAFFAKLSLDAKIGGVVRTIPKGEVARSVGINNLLKADRAALPAGFKTINEVFGVMPNGLERGGMLVREIPKEVRRGQARYVPLFALYSQPNPGQPPLLADMIARSGLGGEEFIQAKILRPFIAQWLALAIDRGIVMEPHAQNVLLALGPDGLPTGSFLHRDFGGFNADFDYRAKRGHPQARLPVITVQEKDYHTSSHVAALKQSLHNYFVGGFVYNLDKHFPRWVARGWVKSQADAVNFEKVLIAEFEAAYEEMTGLKADLRGSFANAAQAVLKARHSKL